MKYSQKKLISAFLSIVLIIPMQVKSVSAEDEELPAEEEIQQVDEPAEDEQTETVTDEDVELQNAEQEQEPQGKLSEDTSEHEPAELVTEEVVQEGEDTGAENVSEETEEQEDVQKTEEAIVDAQSETEIGVSEEDNDPSEDDGEGQDEPAEETKEPSILYQLHLSNVGWTQNYQNGETSAEGRIEALRITSENLNGQISYQSHVQNIGWMSEVSSDAVSGTTGQNRQIEALRIFLSGDAVNEYDVAYRVKIREYGWTGWALNGYQCGSEGYSLSLLGLEVRLVPKGSVESDPYSCFFKKSEMTIQAHVQNKGWLKAVGNGNTAGTTGRSLRLEALRITLPADLRQLGDIEAYAHVSNLGWTGPSGSGQLIGTTGQSRSVEAIRISLTGQLTELYDIRYRAHVRNLGWLNYAFNGDIAGTVGYGLPVEAVEILLEKKGGLFVGTGAASGYAAAYEYQRIQYTAHVANEGWKTQVSSPKTAGSIGRKHPIEALVINLPEQLSELGTLEVSAHVQNRGWLDPVENGTAAGTTGESLRMEGIRITLSGQLAELYDIYYRTYVQGLGWLGWTRNGGLSGSEGCSRWIEGVQIDLVDKAYKKYSLSKSYTTLKLSGNTSTLISILKGNLGTNMSGFGGYSVPAAYKNALWNEVRSIQGSGYKVGFVMIDLGSGKGVSYSADLKLYSASSVKGLYIGALLAQNRSAYNNDRANIQAILRTSDNVLYNALGNKYGFSYIRNWCSSTGIDSNVCANLYTYYSARDMAKLWVKMNEFFSSGSYGNEVGTWYQNPNRSPIHSQLGGRYTTRSKAGWISESGYSAAVDGGIVYSPKGSYIITVISNMPASLDRLNGIVNILENIHNSMN